VSVSLERTRWLTRRQFLALGVGVLFLLLAIYVATVWRRYQLRMGYDWGRIRRYAGEKGSEVSAWARNAHLSPAERIQRAFSYLQLEPGTAEAFVTDYTRHRAPLRRFVPPPDAQEDFFDRFLLSTDFFQHGADESRRVRYSRFYDPYVNPCWNPFLPGGTTTPTAMAWEPLQQ
jgi:hypothetical protein